MDESTQLTRRTVLKQVIFITGVAAGLGTAQRAYAQKASKAAVKYQDKPNGSQECDNCQQFRPPDACAVVDGKISPKGWCLAWTKKS